MNACGVGRTNSPADGVNGTRGSDQLSGTPADDLLRGHAGDDTLLGLGGNDTLVGGTGSDILDGGDGFDIVSFASLAGSLVVNIAEDATVQAGDGIDTLLGIEGVITGSGNDHITGNDDANLIDGGSGNDTISGGHGADTVIGGGGDDSLSAAGGGVSLAGGKGDDALVAGLQAEGTVTNTLNGGDGNDVLSVYGRADGDALVFGGAGNDDVFCHITSNIFCGSGNDSVSFSGPTAGMSLVYGGEGGDSLQGAGALYGQAGDDTLAGVGGHSFVTLSGGRGDDVVQVAKGAHLDLRVGGQQDDGFETVSLRGVENLNGVSSFTKDDPGEMLTGDKNDNRLDGQTGADTLVGHAGDDTLIGDRARLGGPGASMNGGIGEDHLVSGHLASTLTGGAGSDVFQFKGDGLVRTAAFSEATIITDLHNEDSIDLSNFRIHEDYSFKLVAHFTGAPDELQLVYDRAAHMTWLEGTTDSDADPELLIGLAGKHLDFSNFVL